MFISYFNQMIPERKQTYFHIKFESLLLLLLLFPLHPPNTEQQTATTLPPVGSLPKYLHQDSWAKAK